MGTKVLSPAYTDKYYKSFIDLLGSMDKRSKKTLSNLVNVQYRWIVSEHQQGVERCKSMWEEFRTWVSLGCDPVTIPPLTQRHSLRGRLQDAMRLVVHSEGDNKVKLINLIATALRFHELYGCYPEAQPKKWAKLRSTIEKGYSARPLAFATMMKSNRDTIALQYLSSNSELSAYHAMSLLTDFLEALPHEFVYVSEKGLRSYNISAMGASLRAGVTPYHQGQYLEEKTRSRVLYSHAEAKELNEHSARPLSHVGSRIRVKCDECEILVKKSPHAFLDTQGIAHRIISIIGNPMDPYVLQQRVNWRTTRMAGPNRTPVERPDPELQDATIYDVLLEIAGIFNQSQTTSDTFATPERKIDGPCPENLIPRLGEIIPIQDKAGKLRPIATTVYTVNAILQPLHAWMFEILSQLPSDATNQQSGLDFARQMSAQHGVYIKSTDLTSATDRLPRFIQRVVLQAFLFNFSQLNTYESGRIAYLWDVLMGSLRFHTPDGDDISYGTGQPMGVYTSWPMLALTNHAIAMAACYSNRPHGRLKNSYLWRMTRSMYRVCGDDFFVIGEDNANTYTDMMNAFGVEVNEKKSYVSNYTLPAPRIEFCKKLFVGGKLVSGYSPKVLLRSFDKQCSTMIPSAIKSLRDINNGKALSKKVYAQIASRYPGILHSIPLEYGGLGYVTNVPRSAVLSKDCFLIFFHWNKIKQLKTFIPRYFVTAGQDSQDSLGGQLDICKDVPTSLPPNRYRKYDTEWRYLLQTKTLSGPSTLIDSIDFVYNTLTNLLFYGVIYVETLEYYSGLDMWGLQSSIIQSGYNPHECIHDLDNIGLVMYIQDVMNYIPHLLEPMFESLAQLTLNIEDEVKPSLFLGAKSPEDSHESTDTSSAKLALKWSKLIQRIRSGRTDCYLIEYQEDPLVSDVIVSLTRAFDTQYHNA